MAYNNPQLIKILAVIVKKPDPTWASFNLGVFICMNCSGVHRMLGTHITRVRSITLDHWDEAGCQTMAQVGNRLANMYWEAKMPPMAKINANSDEQTRTRFIRAKYEQRMWYAQPNEAQTAAANATELGQVTSSRPEEAGLTREQKIALRQQQRAGNSTSNSPTQSLSPSAAAFRTVGPQPQSQSSCTQTFEQPANHMRHATSLPQLATSATVSSSGDLFAGLTPRSQTQSPPPSFSSRYSPTSQQIQQQQQAEAQPLRSRRVTGSSPWVQRPPGSEPVLSASLSAISISSDIGFATNAYAGMLQGTEATSDLMTFGASHTNQLTPIVPVVSSSFDFLSDTSAIGGAEQTSNNNGNSSFSFLDSGPSSAAIASTTEHSGFDFVSETSSSAPSHSSFDFVEHSNGGIDQFSATKSKKSRVIEDVFSDLVPDQDVPPPELALLESNVSRKLSGDPLAAAAGLSYSLPSYGSSATPMPSPFTASGSVPTPVTSPYPAYSPSTFYTSPTVVAAQASNNNAFGF